jgi:hypothetical protein
MARIYSHEGLQDSHQLVRTEAEGIVAICFQAMMREDIEDFMCVAVQ